MIVEHPFVRRGLAELINQEADLECCGELEGAIGMPEALARSRPDLVLVDSAQRNGGSVELIEAIREFAPRLCIVALAAGDSNDEILRMLSAGADACVRKLDAPQRLIAAIRRTDAGRNADGRIYLDRLNGGWAAHARRGSADRRIGALDATERRIVELTGQGMPARGIAVQLGLSVNGVEARRRHIRAKLNGLTATQLVDFCVRWDQQRRDAIPNRG